MTRVAHRLAWCALPLLLMTGCGSSGGGGGSAAASAEPASEPTSFTVRGKLGLLGGGFGFAGGKGKPCFGKEGYDDIRPGAQVVVRDGDGTKVALGSLGAGTSGGSYNAYCIFSFTVENVPTGRGIYSVEVTSRGEVSFNEDEAGSVELSLG